MTVQEHDNAEVVEIKAEKVLNHIEDTEDGSQAATIEINKLELAVVNAIGMHNQLEQVFDKLCLEYEHSELTKSKSVREENQELMS